MHFLQYLAFVSLLFSTGFAAGATWALLKRTPGIDANVYDALRSRQKGPSHVA